MLARIDTRYKQHDGLEVFGEACTTHTSPDRETNTGTHQHRYEQRQSGRMNRKYLSSQVVSSCGKPSRIAQRDFAATRPPRNKAKDSMSEPNQWAVGANRTVMDHFAYQCVVGPRQQHLSPRRCSMPTSKTPLESDRRHTRTPKGLLSRISLRYMPKW